MSKNSQDGNQATEPEDFSDEFKRIASEDILRQYESKNRIRISESSLAVRDAFDRQWKKVTDKSYYQPVTTAPVVPAATGQNNTTRTNPKSRKYLASIQFSKIIWNKLPRRKIGKRFKDLYNLKGVESFNGMERPIYMNVDADQLKKLLGDEARDGIIETSKKIDHGEVEGDFIIDVEGYWTVIFSPQQDTNDTKDVQLMWEGQCLLIQRMKEVILPGFYIEVADNTLLDNFTQEPGEGRKKVGTIQRYPYTTLEESNREAYLAAKAKGDSIQRAAILREENK